jgi:hypothetical protein
MDSKDIFIFAFVAIFFVAFIVFFILYMRNLVMLLQAVKLENRRLNANAPWFLLVSILNVFLTDSSKYFPVDTGALYGLVTALHYLLSFFITGFQFYLVVKIADSLMEEFHSRNILYTSKPTFNLGIWMCICGVVCYLALIPELKVLGGIAAIAYLVLFILYWVKTHQIKKRLQAEPELQPEEDSIFKNLY